LRDHGVRRKAHAPKTGSGFGEAKFDVANGIPVRLRFDDLANDFLFRFFVGEKNQLSGAKNRSNPDYGTVAKHKNGLRAFRKRLALIGACESARTIDRDRHFESDRLRAR
jgi:hypothetical protein